MTYVEQLHAAVDRIAEADHGIQVAEGLLSAAHEARQEIVDDLHGLLAIEQPEQGKRPLSRDAAVGEHPAPVSQPEAAGSPDAPPADACPECGFEGRTSQGVAVHRRRRHGVIGAHHDPARPQPRPAREAAVAARNGTPLHPLNGAHPSRNEKFLCARCSASFLTRELRDAHQAEASCAPIPTRPPTGPAPLGSLRGGISGFGE